MRLIIRTISNKNETQQEEEEEEDDNHKKYNDNYNVKQDEKGIN
jgi:hypothetical protein